MINKQAAPFGVWVSLAAVPTDDGIYIGRTKSGERVCIEARGGAWLDQGSAVSWFRTPDDEVCMGYDAIPMPGLEASEGFLDPVSDAELRTMTSRLASSAESEFATTATLARKELSLLNVEVFRVYRVGVKKSGIVVGKALSVSENFTAQATPDGGVVIHELSRLTPATPDTHIQPGSDITVVYEDGEGLVHMGQMECFGLRVSAEGLTDDEVTFIRDRMQTVIAGRFRWVELSQSDLNSVVTSVCQQAMEKFNWPHTPRSLIVSKIDVVAEQLRSAMSEADRRGELAADEKGFQPAPPAEAAPSPRLRQG
jgi:hypothetical protein